MPGNQHVVSGAKVSLTEMDRLSGDYLVNKSTHTITRSGYSTACEVSFV